MLPSGGAPESVMRAFGRLYGAFHDQRRCDSRTHTAADNTAFAIIAAISFCHLLNDMMQSLIAALYPMLKTNYGLDFGQIGLLTFTFQVTASLLQPLIGVYTDKRPQPYSLSLGMGFTLVGLILLAFADRYWLLLVASAMVGIGSSVFHPESSRIARMASGGRLGLAQSLFQVGGNFGSALGPLLAAFIVLPRGQSSVAWFSLAALVAMIILWQVGNWVSRSSGGHEQTSAAFGSRDRIAAPQDPDGADSARHPDLRGVEFSLHGEPVELLHILSHP